MIGKVNKAEICQCEKTADVFDVFFAYVNVDNSFGIRKQVACSCGKITQVLERYSRTRDLIAREIL